MFSTCSFSRHTYNPKPNLLVFCKRFINHYAEFIAMEEEVLLLLCFDAAKAANPSSHPYTPNHPW